MSGKQEKKEDKMGGDECAEQGEVTDPATCRRRVIPALVAPTPTPTLCHTLSCSANDTLKVNSRKIANNCADPHRLRRHARTCSQKAETCKRFSRRGRRICKCRGSAFTSPSLSARAESRNDQVQCSNSQACPGQKGRRPELRNCSSEATRQAHLAHLQGERFFVAPSEG